jgi:ubiquinone/menaquinone biosynthesis C-methylase UbiE
MTGTSWNRIRYGAAAPFYDVLLGPLQALGFRAARRRAFELLAPEPGSRLLIVGCGTGLDLEHVPPGVEVFATDLASPMVKRVLRRSRSAGRPTSCAVMDGEALGFPEASFDHVALHLILAVMPDPETCAAEVARILKPAGTVSVFDKFVADGQSPSPVRRALNVVARPIATDLTRRLGPILETGGLGLRHREPWLGGLMTVAVAGKPPNG